MLWQNVAVNEMKMTLRLQLNHSPKTAGHAKNLNRKVIFQTQLANSLFVPGKAHQANQNLQKHLHANVKVLISDHIFHVIHIK